MTKLNNPFQSANMLPDVDHKIPMAVGDIIPENGYIFFQGNNMGTSKDATVRITTANKQKAIQTGGTFKWTYGFWAPAIKGWTVDESGASNSFFVPFRRK